jgi:translation initiation factor IF-1
MITHKFTVELEEYFLAKTHINGKRLRAYIEINIS